MDYITKSIVADLLKAGNCVDMVCFELGITPLDIQKAIRETDQKRVTNILAEQLASRLPALLELTFKQLESILLNDNADRRLRAASIIVTAASAIAKVKH